MPTAAEIEFQWPAMLWLLALAPLAAALYARLLARRRREAALYPSLELVGGARASRGAAALLLGNLPPLLMLAGIALLLAAVARPQASLVMPSRAQSIMLVMDVSGSMRAADIKPDRISAAKDAAKAFIEAQPRDAKVGIVSLAASAAVAQSPTRRRDELHAAIERFQLQRGTALGSGIVVALATLLPEAGIDAEKHINGYSTRSMVGAQAEPPKPVAPGSNGSVAMVLLSDGQSNTGPDPLKMAQLAAEHGVRVYTVGIGTAEGATLSVNGWSMRVRLDEEALKRIAALTRADYFQAGSAAELKRIYGSLAAQLAVERKRPTEVTAVFAALGALFASAAALLSLLWYGRIL